MEAVTTDRFGGNPHLERYDVHAEHAPDARRFLRYVAEHARTFLAGMLASTLAALALGIGVMLLVEGEGERDFWLSVLYGPYAVVLGFFIVRYPFATPETVRWFGLRSARTLARASGWLCAGLGLWIFLRAW